MKIILCLILITLSTPSMAKRTAIFKSFGGKKAEFYQNYTIVKNPDGTQTITLKFMEKNELNREHIVTLDSQSQTTHWKFFSPITKLSIDAYRKGSKIFLTGLKNNQKTEKEFEVGNDPWLQIFPTGLESFALSTKDSQVFWSIGIEGPGEMKIGDFIAKHEKAETLKNEEALTLSFTFNDWKSTFWKGKSWHHKKDGHLLGIHVGRDIGTWELQSKTSDIK